MDEEAMNLLVFGVHQHDAAASAAIIDRVSACDQDWRRVDGVPTLRQLNNYKALKCPIDHLADTPFAWCSRVSPSIEAR